MKKLLIVFGISAIAFACNSSDEKPADEKKQDTVAATPALPDTKGLELIGASDCTTCHKIDQKNIGPAYVDVAAKYENTPAVIDTLVSKVINGGSGNWGTVQMTPHPTLPEADVREMIKYIMTLKK
ncbi:MAG TPA: c-type cytochrome [Flavitalea sp.]|nr:c-type cytochrome [Flavitalea sp.]